MSRKWEDYKPNWYKASIKVESKQKFNDILQWLDDYVPGHRKHTVWRLTGGGQFEIRFRHAKDYEWFIIRWG